MYYQRFLCLKTLADGLRTGETEWVEPLDSTSPADLTKVFLEGFHLIDFIFLSI